MNTARQGARSSGTQTAALVAGGGASPPYNAQTELYNGTAWAEVNDLNLAR